MQLLGAVLVVSAVVVGLTASHAGAATLSNGTVAIRMTSSGSVATNPLHNHDVVNVVVAANSTLSQSSLQAAGFPSGTTPIKVLECADLNGSTANLPKKPTDCDPTTISSRTTVVGDGRVFANNYTIYALPDPDELGPSNGTVCDDAEHQCVLGVFSDQNDFTKPYVFSAPFQVAMTGAIATGTSGSSSTGSASTGSSTANGASAAVSVAPATLANTGGPAWWPWLLGAGILLLVVGSSLRYLRRPASAHRGTR